MALFEWDDQYSVGVKMFDDQHRQLVEMINELATAAHGRAGADTLPRTLEGVVSYTKTHFAAEEAEMRRHGYPAFAAHKAEHEALVQQVSEFVDLVSGGTRPVVEMLLFLKDWLINHILGTDKHYTEFFRSRGVK